MNRRTTPGSKSHATIGERDRLFTLEMPIDTPDGFGGAIRTFQPGPMAWGAIEFLRAAEQFRAGERQEVATHRVTLPWRDDLDGVRLSCGTRRFRVRSADDPDGRRREIVCLVEEMRP